MTAAGRGGGGGTARYGGSSPEDVLEDYRQLRIFINVFKSHERTLDMVAGLLASDVTRLANFSIAVQCNWGTFAFPDAEPFASHARSLVVLHNVLRSHLSLGHLAREWNAGLVRGFGSLRAPLADVVVLLHGDVYLSADWAVEVHAALTAPGGTFFLQQGFGDAFMAFAPDAVRTIGLFDENFCDRPSYQEGDYFLRALVYARERVSVNDAYHQRVHRPWRGKPVVLDSGKGDGLKVRGWGDAWYSRHYWNKKWPGVSPSWPQGTEFARAITKPAVPMHVLYPYFEDALINPAALGYDAAYVGVPHHDT